MSQTKTAQKTWISFTIHESSLAIAPKGSKGLEHLGQEIRRNLQQIVPIGFHHRHEVLSRELAGRILQWPWKFGEK